MTSGRCDPRPTTQPSSSRRWSREPLNGPPITATVPPDATSGSIIIVTLHGSVTSTAAYQVLPPPLAVRGAIEGQVEISWSATSDAFVLQSASELAEPVWEPVSAPVRRADGQTRVLVRGAEAARFFRLKAP